MNQINHETALTHFHRQVRYVLDHYQSHGKKASDYQNVIIGGLGGSGIGGRIARLAFYTVFPVPIEVFSEYHLPAYAGSNTLVILSSYSGNTEETLSMYDDAKKRGCDILVLSGGGSIVERANADGNQVYAAETGYQPRMALGYSLSTLLLILGELAGIDMRNSLIMVEELLNNNQGIISKSEQMLACFRETVNNKFVVVCDLPFEGAAIRFCQQIQENAKGEAFVSVLPEANHNMIESYYEKRDTNFIFLNSGLNPRVTLRFDYLRSVLAPKGNVIFEYPVSDFGLAAIFEVIHATDWLSIMISNAKNADNMQVSIISGLKEFLEKN